MGRKSNASKLKQNNVVVSEESFIEVEKEVEALSDIIEPKSDESEQNSLSNDILFGAKEDLIQDVPVETLPETIMSNQILAASMEVVVSEEISAPFTIHSILRHIDDLIEQLIKNQNAPEADIIKQYSLYIGKHIDIILTEAIVTTTAIGKQYYNSRKYRNFDIKLDFSGNEYLLEFRPNTIHDKVSSGTYREYFKDQISSDGTLKSYGIISKQLADKLIMDFKMYLSEYALSEIRVGGYLKGSIFNHLIPNQISYFPDYMVLNVDLFDRLLSEIRQHNVKEKK